jgi:hypothetical protein
VALSNSLFENAPCLESETRDLASTRMSKGESGWTANECMSILICRQWQLINWIAGAPAPAVRPSAHVPSRRVKGRWVGINHRASPVEQEDTDIYPHFFCRLGPERHGNGLGRTRCSFDLNGQLIVHELPVLVSIVGQV